MTTKPNNKLFNRDLAIVESKDFINHSSKLLRELVSNSTMVLSRCHECSTSSDEDSTIFILYLHIMKMTDGIEVLVSELCLDSAKLLLKSSFEALLSLEFILKSNTKKRALAWLFCYARTNKRIKNQIIINEAEMRRAQQTLKYRQNNVEDLKKRIEFFTCVI